MLAPRVFAMVKRRWLLNNSRSGSEHSFQTFVSGLSHELEIELLSMDRDCGMGIFLGGTDKQACECMSRRGDYVANILLVKTRRRLHSKYIFRK